MWFLNSIVSWLDSVTGYFYDAYQEVSGWVFPFHYLSTPLYWLYHAFYYLTHYFGEFNNWLVWAAGRIDVILSTWDIWSYFETWFTYAQDAWSWVYNALYNVWNICNDWWSSAQYTVIGWIQDVQDYASSLFNQAVSLIAPLEDALASVIAWLPSIEEVISWWGNWTGNVWATITSWWSGAIGEVLALINSAFLEREPFWAGWQDWRDSVTEFFSDPLQWLYNKMDEWFERFW